MGNYSTIRDFELFPFTLNGWYSPDELKRLLEQKAPGSSDELDYWFAIEIDEDDHSLIMEPRGESGKAYALESALNALISVLSGMQARDSRGGSLEGIRFRFVLWGYEEAALLTSDGKSLYRTPGEMVFSGTPQKV